MTSWWNCAVCGRLMRPAVEPYWRCVRARRAQTIQTQVCGACARRIDREISRVGVNDLLVS